LPTSFTGWSQSRATDGPYLVYLIYGGALQSADAVAEFIADLT
jgi:hypothetical protein